MREHSPEGQDRGSPCLHHSCGLALGGVHHDAGHRGWQGTLALTQERFW